MNLDELYKKILDAYRIYYNLDETGEPPFDATAVFQRSTDQYFLIRKARVAHYNEAEYVYFAKRDHLTASELKDLDQTAWGRGCKHIIPSPDHKCSDVILILVADTIDEDVKALIPKLKHSQSYRFGFYGYSNYKLAVIESSTAHSLYNGQGKALKRLVTDILKSN